MKLLKIAFVGVAILFSADVSAKISSNVIEGQAQNILTAISACDIDGSILDSIKKKSVGSAVTSSIATAGSGLATAGSVMAAVDTRKNGQVVKDANDKDVELKSNLEKDRKLRVGSTIASGVATGANLVSVTLSGTSVSKLGELIDSVDACNVALDAIMFAQ